MIQRYSTSHAAKGLLVASPTGALVTYDDHQRVALSLLRRLEGETRRRKIAEKRWRTRNQGDKNGNQE